MLHVVDMVYQYVADDGSFLSLLFRGPSKNEREASGRMSVRWVLVLLLYSMACWLSTAVNPAAQGVTIRMTAVLSTAAAAAADGAASNTGLHTPTDSGIGREHRMHLH